MLEQRRFRLFLFAGLYFAQGTILSYFLTFNILYLGEAGYGPADIGIFQAVLVLPFVLKLILGILSDGVNLFGLGHRKPYIIIGLIGQAVAMFIAPSISVADGLGAFAAIAFLGSTSMALYDTCTDGLALDSTPEDERGVVQGIMGGGRAAGIFAMLLAGGFIADKFDWQWVFYLVGLMPLIPLFLVFKVQEDASTLQREPFQWGAFRKFGESTVLMLAGIGLIYSMALDGILTFLSDYVHNVFAVSIGSVGLLVAVSMVGRIVGALSNGWITDRMGHKQSLFVAIGLTTLSCIGLAVNGNLWVIGIFTFLFGLAYGYYAAVYGAVAMSLSDSRISASMFAIFMVFVNLGTVGGQILGGMFTESMGFNMMVVVMGAINLINIFLVIGVFKRRATSQPA